MSTNAHDIDPEDPEELSDDELLRYIAEMDPDKVPVAKYARRALGWDQEFEEESS